MKSEKHTLESVVKAALKHNLRATFHLEPIEGTRRKCHMASKVNHLGHVSALCFRKPHSIAPKETWTLIKEQVTCQSCLKALSKISVA